MNLNQYKKALRTELADLANQTWANDALEQAMRQALEDYNQANLDEAIGLITLASASREISVAALGGRIRILRVWLPYAAASPEHPPRWRHDFQEWPGGILYISDDPRPAPGDVARIWYNKLRTIEGLDAAAATTVHLQHTHLIITGAASFAASSRARQIQESATIDDDTYKQVSGFAFRKLNEFRAGLNNIRKAPAGAHVQLAPARRTVVRK